MDRKYAWIPDRRDERDFLFSTRIAVPVELPPKVDLRPGFSPVEDQGELGSCTANALAGAIEFLEIKDRAPFFDASRLFIYYNERVIEGTVGEDAGAEIRDGIKTLAKQGVCTEKRWPYNIAKFKKKPGCLCYSEAKKHKIGAYHSIQSLSEMKSCLASGFPFVFGFTVFESFESAAVAKTGVVPMPGSEEQVLGGHAVLAVGYDDASSRFIIRNSWGVGWGQSGYFTLPYAYFTNRDLSDDFWMIEGGAAMLAEN